MMTPTLCFAAHVLFLAQASSQPAAHAEQVVGPVTAVATAPAAPAERKSWLNAPDAPYQVSLHAEVGFVTPLAHTIQFSSDGTQFDYVAEGAQDNLFPLLRLSADLRLFDRHTVVLLYQPLDLQTRTLLERDVSVDGLVYPSGTPLDLRYGFTYWRLSYLFDFLPEPEAELAIGASLQLRNATIDFASVDGELLRSNRDVGPVPILKARARLPIAERYWVGAEADGFWAPIRYINGGTSDVEGAILDATVRGGLTLDAGVDAYLGLRYVGGGARGTDQSPEGPGDGYVENWIHLLALSLGFSLR